MRLARLGLVAGALACAAVFVGLGIWQLERRVWKHALIARVEARVATAPVAAPDTDRWSRVDAAGDEYRRVEITGRWLGQATRVQAVTELGPGGWALSPLRRPDGTIVFVNRGFVPDGTPLPVPPDNEPARVTGLLRMSEPHGGFLRHNDALHDRWYSRDVAALAASRALTRVAPYFVDADARPGDDRPPVGGLTVVRFRDDHLVYALTWFALAALSGWGAWRFARAPDHADAA